MEPRGRSEWHWTEVASQVPSGGNAQRGDERRAFRHPVPHFFGPPQGGGRSRGAKRPVNSPPRAAAAVFPESLAFQATLVDGSRVQPSRQPSPAESARRTRCLGGTVSITRSKRLGKRPIWANLVMCKLFRFRSIGRNSLHDGLEPAFWGHKYARNLTANRKNLGMYPDPVEG